MMRGLLVLRCQELHCPLADGLGVHGPTLDAGPGVVVRPQAPQANPMGARDIYLPIAVPTQLEPNLWHSAHWNNSPTKRSKKWRKSFRGSSPDPRLWRGKKGTDVRALEWHLNRHCARHIWHRCQCGVNDAAYQRAEVLLKIFQIQSDTCRIF